MHVHVFLFRVRTCIALTNYNYQIQYILWFEQYITDFTMMDMSQSDIPLPITVFTPEPAHSQSPVTHLSPTQECAGHAGTARCHLGADAHVEGKTTVHMPSGDSDVSV